MVMFCLEHNGLSYFHIFSISLLYISIYISLMNKSGDILYFSYQQGIYEKLKPTINVSH